MGEQLSEFFKIRKWLRGLVGAFIGSASNCITNMIVDPSDFNIHDSNGLHNLMYTAIVSGVVGAALYLKQHSTWEE